MNNKKLAQQLEKYYYSHGQQLIVDTWEVMENNDRDCMFDVILEDSDICLFTIQNYNGFKDLEFINKSYFKENKYTYVETWDGVRASCQPLYFEDMITLKKWEPITKEDIVKATDYFVHEILRMTLFNIIFTKKEH